MGNITDMIATMYRLKGFARPNRFLAFIIPNTYVLSTYLGGIQSNLLMNRLAMTCTNASLPARTFDTHEIKITSPARIVPYLLNTNNSSGAAFDFYCLGDFFEKTIFENWQRGIIDPKTKEVDYYDNYAKGSSIYVVQFPSDIGNFEDVANGIGNYSTKLTGVQLTEVYPRTVTINDGSVSSAPTLDPLKMKVEFMYRDIIRIDESISVPSQNDGVRYVKDNGVDVSGNVGSSTISTGRKYLSTNPTIGFSGGRIV